MSNRGITLLELLVSIAITSLLIVLLSSTLQSLTTSTNRSAGRIEAEREARAALEFLQRDLYASLSRSDGLGRPSIVNDPNWEGSHWLTFLSTPLDHSPNEPGDVCLMSYRVGLDDTIGISDGIPVLYRLRLDSTATFDTILGGESPVNLDAIESASVEQDNWLASGVVALQIKALVEGEVIEITNDPTEDSNSWEALEVTVEVLTTTGRMQYGTVPLEELRERYGYRFTRRIRLPAFIP